MPTTFGNAWYVLKDRIQIFLPLADDLHFEIDKTENGSIIATGATQYATSQFGESVIKSMVFNGSNHLTLNDAVNNLISKAVYGKGGKRTIVFWSAPSNDTTLASIPNLGITRNMILSDSYAYGYGFGVDTHTSTLNLDNIAQGSESYSKHILTMVDTQRITTDGNESEVESLGSGTVLNIPTDKWIMTTYVIDHSNSSNYKMEIHLRWYDSDSGAKVHFWRKSENMNYDDIETLQGRADIKSTIWTIGCAINANRNPNPSIYFNGKLRNIMLYNCILTDAQQNTMFANGIDPYVAAKSTNTEADEDQYDKQFWGMYGVIATESNVKVEKTIFASYSDSDSASNSNTFAQNKGRFGIASRDGSIITFARDEVPESESTNPEIFDRTNNNNSFGDEVNASNAIMAVKSAAWRGGLITGDKKLSRDESRAIWGGIINGDTDMMRIDNTIDPESLPSGKYITSWNWDSNNNNYVGNIDSLKSFIPKYYYRDRLGRSWRIKGSTNNGDNATKFINEIFWDKQTRYEKILWNNKMNSDENPAPTGDTSITAMDQNMANDTNQISNAGNWEPVYWVIAIYEVVREPSLTTNGFANRINLTLINNDGTRYATYHKVRMRNNSYGGWMFDSFDSFLTSTNESALANEFLNRIYLPHIRIPKISIPLFKDDVKAIKNNVSTVTNKQDTELKSMQNMGGLVYFYSRNYGNDDGKQYFKAFAGSGDTVNVTTNSTVTQSGANLSDTIVIPKTGLYEFTAAMSEYFGDNNSTLTFALTYTVGEVTRNISRSFYMGDYVGGGSTGGAPDTTVIKIVKAFTRGTSVQIGLTATKRSINGVWISGNFLSEWYGSDGSNYVSNVIVTDASSADSDRYNAFVKDDSADSTKKHIELTDIAAYYTKTQRGKQDNGADTSINQWLLSNGVNLIDIEKPSYEYYFTRDTTYQAGKTYYYKNSNGQYLVKTGYTVGENIPSETIYEV